MDTGGRVSVDRFDGKRLPYIDGLVNLVMAEDLGELIRAQRAAAWREVARRIAHEIKNPLTPIQLAAQRLRKKFTSGSSDLHEVIPVATASIEREVGALKQLVDDLSLDNAILKEVLSNK